MQSDTFEVSEGQTASSFVIDEPGGNSMQNYNFLVLSGFDLMTLGPRLRSHIFTHDSYPKWQNSLQSQFNMILFTINLFAINYSCRNVTSSFALGYL
jgi:hypothetical protein